MTSRVCVCVVAGASKDSGLGDSDGIVFGNTSSSTDLAGSDVSGSETEGDSESVTSWEDVSHLSADLLLYKAAQAKNPVAILQALAMGAQPNWHNSEEQGRTALIQGIRAVSHTSAFIAYHTLNMAVQYFDLTTLSFEQPVKWLNNILF